MILKKPDPIAGFTKLALFIGKESLILKNFYLNNYLSMTYILPMPI